MHQYEGFSWKGERRETNAVTSFSRPDSPIAVAVPVVGKVMAIEAIARNARARNFMLKWEIKWMFSTLGSCDRWGTVIVAFSSYAVLSGMFFMEWMDVLASFISLLIHKSTKASCLRCTSMGTHVDITWNTY